MNLDEADEREERNGDSLDGVLFVCFVVCLSACVCPFSLLSVSEADFDKDETRGEEENNEEENEEEEIGRDGVGENRERNGGREDEFRGA